MTNAGANWAVARPGSRLVIGTARFGIDGGASRQAQRYETGVAGLRRRELCPLLNLPSQRPSLRMVGVQGRSVSADLEGTKPSAPATAHVKAIFVEGGAGPYTWRRPV